MSFPDRVIFRACSPTSPTTQARMKWPLMQQDSDLVIGVSVVPDRNSPESATNQGLLLIVLTGNGTNFASIRILTSNRRKPVMPFKSGPQNKLMLLNTVSECNQLSLSFAMNKWIMHKMAVPVPTSHNDLNQEEVTAPGHHRPQVCAVEDHLLHHEQSICAGQLVTWLTEVLCESKKEQVEKPPEPTQ